MIFYVQSDNFLLFGRQFSIFIHSAAHWILHFILNYTEFSMNRSRRSMHHLICVHLNIVFQFSALADQKIATKLIWCETSVSTTSPPTTTPNNKGYKHVSIANSIQLCVHKTKRNMFRFSLDLNLLRILSFSLLPSQNRNVSFLIIHRLATTMNSKWNENEMEGESFLWYLCDEWWTIKSNGSWIYLTILFNLLPLALFHINLRTFSVVCGQFFILAHRILINETIRLWIAVCGFECFPVFTLFISFYCSFI